MTHLAQRAALADENGRNTNWRGPGKGRERTQKRHNSENVSQDQPFDEGFFLRVFHLLTHVRARRSRLVDVAFALDSAPQPNRPTSGRPMSLPGRDHGSHTQPEAGMRILTRTGFGQSPDARRARRHTGRCSQVPLAVSAGRSGPSTACRLAIFSGAICRMWRSSGKRPETTSARNSVKAATRSRCSRSYSAAKLR